MKHALRDALQKISEQKIVPEPKWKFLTKKYALWFLFGTLVFLGSASFSITYDAISQLDWDVYRFVHESSVLYTLSLVPYFWILSIGILLFFAFVDLRKTENGYRYGIGKLSIASIGGVLILGFFFVGIGWGGKWNDLLMKEIPYYQNHLTVTKEAQWMQPDRGLLAGTVQKREDQKIFLTDLSGNSWNVLLTSDTIVRPAVLLQSGERVKIIGSKGSGQNFQAQEIRPWIGRGMMNGNGRMSGGGMMRGE